MGILTDLVAEDKAFEANHPRPSDRARRPDAFQAAEQAYNDPEFWAAFHRIRQAPKPPLGVDRRNRRLGRTQSQGNEGNYQSMTQEDAQILERGWALISAQDSLLTQKGVDQLQAEIAKYFDKKLEPGEIETFAQLCNALGLNWLPALGEMFVAVTKQWNTDTNKYERHVIMGPGYKGLHKMSRLGGMDVEYSVREATPEEWEKWGCGLTKAAEAPENNSSEAKKKWQRDQDNEIVACFVCEMVEFNRAKKFASIGLTPKPIIGIGTMTRRDLKKTMNGRAPFQRCIFRAIRAAFFELGATHALPPMLNAVPDASGNWKVISPIEDQDQLEAPDADQLPEFVAGYNDEYEPGDFDEVPDVPEVDDVAEPQPKEAKDASAEPEQVTMFANGRKFPQPFGDQEE